MKKLLISVLSVVVVLSCILCMTACTASIKDATPEGIQDYGSLVVATNAYFPPFEYHDEDTGDIVGWDIDIAAAFAEKLGVELVVEDMEFDSVLLAPGTYKAHIAMAGISYSEERDESLDFTDGIFNSSQVIIVKTDSDITGPFDLEGKTVAVQSGTVGQLLAEMDPDWAGTGDDACLAAPGTVKKYSTGAEAVLALTTPSSGVDAVIIDKYPAEKFITVYEDTKICETSVYDDEYAFAVKEGNEELVEWLNNAISEMKADGTMDAISAKYFG
jgi:polar amino acid transport system substrate-binding protein